MPNNRRKNRESAFILIFEKQFRDDTCEEIVELAKEINDVEINDQVKEKFISVFEKVEEFDKIITKYSNKRSLDRIPKVNLAILRLALYEIKYDNKVPLNVGINEAVLLAEKFAQKQDASFINGVLGAYAKSIGEE